MDAKFYHGLLLVAVALLAVGAVVALPAAAQSDDRFEPNDHSGEAAEIEPGTYEDLRMAEDEWADYYAVELEAGETLSASADFDHESGDLSMILSTPNRYYADYSFSNSDGESVETTAEESGTYYVAVFGFGSDGTDYDLSVETEGGEPEGDRFENNDDTEEAAGIEPGAHTNLTVSDDDRDVFAVEANEGDQIVAASQIHNANADLSVEVSGNGQSASASAGTEWRPSGLVAEEDGTYYVTVTSEASETVTYDLLVGVGSSDRFDPNEHAGTVPELDPGSYSNLSLVGGPDVDSYDVQLDREDDLQVSASTADDTTAEIFLTNEDGDTVATGEYPVYSNDPQLSYSPNESGTYTVNVNNEAGSATSYDLDLEVDQPEPTYGPGVYENQTVSDGERNTYNLEAVAGGDQIAVATRIANQSDDLNLQLTGPTYIFTSDDDGRWETVGDVPEEETSYQVTVTTESDDQVTYDLFVDDGAADEFDPNEGASEAASIEAGTHENLSLTGPADFDYYTLDLEAGQDVSLETELVEGKQVDLWVSGPDDEQVHVSDSSPYGDDEYVSFVANSNGTYTVQAFNDAVGEHDGSTYDLDVEIEEPEPTFSDGTYANQTVTNGSANTYTLEPVEEGELLAVATELQDSESDLSVSVRGPLEILQDHEGDRWRLVETVTESGGTYEIEVSTEDAESVSYDLEIATGESDPHEPNTWEQKPQIEPGTYENLTAAGVADQDAYAVDLEEGEQLQVDVTEADPSAVSLFVYNEDSGQFEQARIENGSRSLTMVAESSGTYGIAVSANGDYSTEYDLEVDVSES